MGHKETAENPPNPTHQDSAHAVIVPVPDSSKVFFSGLRDRFNFASAACAALVIFSSGGIRSPSAILNFNKDSYMLVPCTNYQKSSFLSFFSFLLDNQAPTKASIVVELCSEIKIDTMVLSNEEYFSSFFKSIRLLGTNRYVGMESPDWAPIAVLEAAPVRGPQVFNLDVSLPFVKYLKLEFSTFHGKEYYCPLTFLAVYGTTMIEDLRYEIARNHTLSASNLAISPTGFVSGVEPKEEHVPAHPEMCPFSPRTSDNNTAMQCELMLPEKNIFALFKRISANAPVSAAQDTRDTSDVIEGNNIFKLIIDRIGALESQTDALSLRLSESLSEIHRLRGHFERLQQFDVNSTTPLTRDSFTEANAHRIGYFSNLYDLVRFQRHTFNCWSNISNPSGMICFLIILISALFCIFIFLSRTMYRKKDMRFKLADVLSTDAASLEEIPDPSTLRVSTPSDNRSVILDSEEIIFPTVDPSLTKSSLLANIAHISSDDELSLAPFFPASPLYMKTSRRSRSPVLNDGKNALDSRGPKDLYQLRSKSLPPIF